MYVENHLYRFKFNTATTLYRTESFTLIRDLHEIRCSWQITAALSFVTTVKISHNVNYNFPLFTGFVIFEGI